MTDRTTERAERGLRETCGIIEGNEIIIRVRIRGETEKGTQLHR